MLSNKTDAIALNHFDFRDSDLPSLTSNTFRSQKLQPNPNLPISKDQPAPLTERNIGSNEKKHEDLPQDKKSPKTLSATPQNQESNLLIERATLERSKNSHSNNSLDELRNSSYANGESSKKQKQYHKNVTSTLQDQPNNDDINLQTNAVMTNVHSPLKVDNLTSPNLTRSQSYISSPLPYTGISCKEKSLEPRMEMRGTNYWVLYNYIPADKVRRFI